MTSLFDNHFLDDSVIDAMAFEGDLIDLSTVVLGENGSRSRSDPAGLFGAPPGAESSGTRTPPPRQRALLSVSPLPVGAPSMSLAGAVMGAFHLPDQRVDPLTKDDPWKSYVGGLAFDSTLGGATASGAVSHLLPAQTSAPPTGLFLASVPVAAAEGLGAAIPVDGVRAPDVAGITAGMDDDSDLEEVAGIGGSKRARRKPTGDSTPNVELLQCQQRVSCLESKVAALEGELSTSKAHQDEIKLTVTTMHANFMARLDCMVVLVGELQTKLQQAQSRVATSPPAPVFAGGSAGGSGAAQSSQPAHRSNIVKVYGFGDSQHLVDSRLISDKINQILAALGVTPGRATARVFDALNNQGQITCQSEQDRDAILAAFEALPRGAPLLDFQGRGIVLAKENTLAQRQRTARFFEFGEKFKSLLPQVPVDLISGKRQVVVQGAVVAHLPYGSDHMQLNKSLLATLIGQQAATMVGRQLQA